MKCERLLSLVTGLSVAVCTVSCGSEKAPSSSSTSSAPPSETAAADEPEAASSSRKSRRGSSGGSTAVVNVVREGDGGTSSGTVSGEAIFVGAAPERRPIAALSNTKGCEGHSGPALSEALIVNDGKLQNVFVYIDKGLEDWTPTPVDSAPLVMDQTGCYYSPHVVGLRLGRTLHALNSDPVSHNVHVVAQRNSDMNKTQGAGSAPIQVDFDKEEVPVTFVCDIHNWMKAYVCVVDHPFFAVTDENGRFQIEGLPPGEYTLKTWHEHRAFERQTAEVTVGSGGEVSVQFSFEDA